MAAERTDGRTDGRTGERADGRADGRADERADGRADRRTATRTCHSEALGATYESYAWDATIQNLLGFDTDHFYTLRATFQSSAFKKLYPTAFLGAVLPRCPREFPCRSWVGCEDGFSSGVRISLQLSGFVHLHACLSVTQAACSHLPLPVCPPTCSLVHVKGDVIQGW